MLVLRSAEAGEPCEVGGEPCESGGEDSIPSPIHAGTPTATPNPAVSAGELKGLPIEELDEFHPGE